MQHKEAPETLGRELDRCVKCGMCLPECPTYRLAGSENESPRGRLALIEGLVSGRLSADEPVIRHLESCLTCRRCERLCPSQVRYGFLIDQGRNLLPPRHARRLSSLITDARLLAAGMRLARLIPASLSRPLGPVHHLHRIARALPATGGAPAPGRYPTPLAKARGRVALFAGCTGPALQGGALSAALVLLGQAGFDVELAAGAGCCGALAQHAGDLDRAARLAEANRAAFAAGLDALVTVASGCGIQFDGYDPPLPVAHHDICRFLLEQGGLTPADFAPLPKAVALHTPCSVENVYLGAAWARQLLSLIPDLEVVPVGETGQCCGAAGDHMLRRPKQAAQLRRPLLESIVQGGHGVLVTSNVGCAMHIAEGLQALGEDVEILHPVELLARQLRR